MLRLRDGHIEEQMGTSTRSLDQAQGFAVRERGSTTQHAISAFHCFYRDASLFTDRDTLANVYRGKNRCHAAAVTNIRFFVFAWLSFCEYALGSKERLEQSCGIDKLDTFVVENALYAADQRGGVFIVERH